MSATTPVGSGIYLYALAVNGRRALAEYLGLSIGDVQRLSYLQDPIFVDHHLAICDFRLKLSRACQSYGLELEHWETERSLRGRKARPEPDGIFTIKGKSFRYEMDMGTVSRKNMLVKLKAYLKDKDRTLVLWDLPDTNRLNRMKEWCLSVATSERLDHTMFLLAIRPENPLDSTWTVVGINNPVSLLGGRWDSS
jgi:hypothetical protein